MKQLIFPCDKYEMNWIREDAAWGETVTPYGLVCRVEREAVGVTIVERYIFKNTLDRYIFTHRGSVSVCTPFPDSYPSTETCIGHRCHVHVWCGEDVSYVMALRMGGEPPHLGLVVTRGALGAYRIVRDVKTMSNDRGIFWLNVAPMTLAPGEEYVLEWVIFPHEGVEDFFNRLRTVNPRHIDVETEGYNLFSGEAVRISFKPVFAFDPASVTVTRDGRPVDFICRDGAVCLEDDTREIGERRYDVSVGGVKTHCTVLVLPPLANLAEARCRFIAEKQQFRAEGHPLDGAYLTYDNEEKRVFYARANDFNSARERVGMGLLLARYLQKHPDGAIRESLDRYMTFLEREIVNVETGDVANDYGRRDPNKRLYNNPWIAELYLELYRLDGKREALEIACRVMNIFYANGGSRFYAFEIPVVDLLAALEKEGMNATREELLACFRRHAETVMENGVFYPAHEVNFEQSIVAPAVTLLIQMYRATGEGRYLAEAQKHLALLQLFDGVGADWHLHTVAIRHWDGYWFGKRKMFGDTLPHYWSALSGVAYRHFAKATEDAKMAKRAEASFRGVMGMFFPDGSATCAWIHPYDVNGIRGEFPDPYANDQDWGLYFMLRDTE